jgi:hypothetical protein
MSHYGRDFRYYAGEGEMEALEKIYHATAERLIPGLR